MASFRFLKDGESVPLSQVDEEICTLFNVTPHPKYCCRIYDQMVEWGFAILMKCGGSFVTVDLINEWADTPARQALLLEDDIKKLMPFLNGEKYTFEAWR